MFVYNKLFNFVPKISGKATYNGQMWKVGLLKKQLFVYLVWCLQISFQVYRNREYNKISILSYMQNIS